MRENASDIASDSTRECVRGRASERATVQVEVRVAYALRYEWSQWTCSMVQMGKWTCKCEWICQCGVPRVTSECIEGMGIWKCESREFVAIHTTLPVYRLHSH